MKLIRLFCLLFGALLPKMADAFDTSANIWPSGETVFKVNFDQSNPSFSVSDRAKFQSAFEEALNLWTNTSTFKFVIDNSEDADPCESSAIEPGNGVKFDNDQCGDGYGASTLAVQTAFFSNNVRVRSNITFNNNITWDVYNGPLQGAASDFRRVAVHELGHTLGLGHENGASAIMEPFISNLEQPQIDDLTGVSAMYDMDGDDVGLAEDNCSNIANADQADTDIDGVGNVCDSDSDGDGIYNSSTVDQSFSTTNISNSFFDLGDGVSAGKLAQTFTVGISGNLEAITLPIYCPSGDLQIAITTLSGSNPSMPVLDSVTYANGFTRSNLGVIRLDLNNVAVTTGDQLAIVVNSTGECRWSISSAGAYPDGTARFSFNGINWSPLGNSDFPFSTLVIPAVLDNCPNIANPNQEDSNMNGLGDVCDVPDTDNDGISNLIDNCEFTPNQDQANLDGDAFGDVCDADADGDNVLSGVDGDDLNGLVCSDSDMDSCDDCSSGVFNITADGLDTDSDGLCDLGDENDDNDVFNDVDDNCSLIVNDDQVDSNGNGIGDACEQADDELCVPIKAMNGKVVVICL